MTLSGVRMTTGVGRGTRMRQASDRVRGGLAEYTAEAPSGDARSCRIGRDGAGVVVRRGTERSGTRAVRAGAPGTRGQPGRKLSRTVRDALSAFGSRRQMDCQVPSARRPSRTGTV